MNFKGWLKYIFSNEKVFIKELKKILGFYPNNLEYYKTAFIHKSATYIDHTGKVVNNERLEFLGDAILDAVIGDYLFNHFPEGSEGFMTQTRSKIVNRGFLTHLATEIHLDEFIILHIQPPFVKKNICGNALEAFIGAVYLDLGYYYAYKFIEKQLLKKHVDLDKVVNSDSNYKSQVIEWAQHEHMKVNFETEQIQGKPVKFEAKIFVNENFFGQGTGQSKKEAEQQAAKVAMEQIKAGKLPPQKAPDESSSNN